MSDGEELFAGAAFLLLVAVFFVAAAAALRGMPAGQLPRALGDTIDRLA